MLCLSDRIHSANSIKDYVHSADENFPSTVNGEKVAQKIEIFSL